MLEITVPTKTASGLDRIGHLLSSGLNSVGQIVTVGGWCRTLRKQGGGKFCFIALSDGSSVKTLQIVVDSCMPGFDSLIKCSSGSSVKVTGELIESPAVGQSVELTVKSPELHKVTICGVAEAATYPLAKKTHSAEFLREISHLRSRTYLIGCVTRMRSHMAQATHQFFHERGCLYIHTPIITASDCEGAGEMFQVSTLIPKGKDDLPRSRDGQVDYKKDFFAAPAFLTVSGQLNVETYSCGLGDCYTFGPTFRAENSHTTRHLAEFWMVEPEIVFADLSDLMRLAEDCLKYLLTWALTKCADDIAWLDKNIDEGLRVYLEGIVAQPFKRMSYTEAIEHLTPYAARFELKPQWGDDLTTEHEKFLTEDLGGPVIVYDYPKSFKAFYMRANEDGKTVAAMDVLLPKIGEVVGGAQREERPDKLDAAIKEKGLELAPYWWYRDLRRFGTVPHAGFGLGFERLVMLVTGVQNIRDVIPFPRYPKHAEF